MKVLQLSLLLLLFAPSLGADEGSPGYRLLRFDEDWSLAQPGPDLLSQIKNMTISDESSIRLSLGGQLRSRVESWDGFGFGGTGQRSDTFWLNRLRYHGDLSFGPHARAFVEVMHSLSSDRDLPGGRRATEHDESALHNAFFDFPVEGLTFRVGRQELLFGSQRLVSPRDWSNVRRTWDGIRVLSQWAGWDVSGFWGALVINREKSFNQSSENTQLFGLYGTQKNGKRERDAYLLGLHQSDAAFGGTRGLEDRFTVGGRTKSPLAETAVMLELEGAYQFGEVGDKSINAFMLSSELSFELRHADWKPKLLLGVDYASGDRRAGGSVQTFNSLFPSGRRFFGHTNTLGRSNLIALSPGIVLRPRPDLTVVSRAHAFWRSSKQDAIYGVTGGVVRGGALGRSREVGLELDVAVTYVLSDQLKALIGYSRLFAGRFIRESGPSDDIQFTYVQAEYTF